MPPNRNVIKVFEEMNPKSVDQACVNLQSACVRLSKEAGPPERTLANQDSGVHTNRRLLIRDEIGVNGGGGGDEGCTSKTMGMSHQRYI